MTGRRAGGGSEGSGQVGRDNGRAILPCSLPQWVRVREEIELLLQQAAGQSNVTHRLDNLHHIAQAREGTDARCASVFRGLGQFLFKVGEDERRRFHEVSLPTILRRALQLPDLVPDDGVPLLLKHQAGQVVLPRRLIASLVACGFLCLFPALPPRLKDSFRSINFTNFFQHLANEPQQAKLRCILHYFERLAQDVDGPAGNITIARKVLESEETHSLDWWQETDVPLCPLLVHHTGVIEDAPHPSVQVDFANKKIGGGVLGTGRVQEEIRFVTCPELLVTMVIMEGMEENEATWVQGFETFSSHEGYAKTLRYTGDFIDRTPVDGHGNIKTMLCAIDALTGASQRQYQDKFILREVNKAFIGFVQKVTARSEEEEEDLEDVANFGQKLSDDILTTAARQAAIVLTQSRLQEHARPPSSGDRYGERLSHKDRSDSSDTTSSDSHHSAPYGIGEGERSWMMGMRRRSSNLSDVGSRRSSDLTSRRSSGSTRYSSDLSSDLEELYESFPEGRQRPAAIKEEVPPGAIGLQDFVSSMVSNVMDEGSNLAAQMMPGVQNFGGAQPLDVAKPKACKPMASGSHSMPSTHSSQQDMSFEFPLDLDSSSDSSNQTDDQKAKENIVRFVSQLVEKAFVGAGGGGGVGGPAGDEEGGAVGGSGYSNTLSNMDHLHLHHSWSSSDSGGSPHVYHHYMDVQPATQSQQQRSMAGGGPSGSSHHQEFPGGAAASVVHPYHLPATYDRGRRLSHPLDSCPRYTPPVDAAPPLPRPTPRLDFYHLTPHHDPSNSSHAGSSFGDISPRSSSQLHDGSSGSGRSMPPLDGSPRSEATAMWRHQEALLLNEVARMSERRRSSTDFAGSLDGANRQQMYPEVGSHAGRPFPLAGFSDSRHVESLTDDLKEAVANSASAFHAVQAAVAAVAAASSHDDEHVPYTMGPDPAPDRGLAEARLAAPYGDARTRSNFQSKSDTSLLSARHSHHYQRQDSIDADLRYGEGLYGHGSTSQEGASGLGPYRLSGGTNTAVTVAGQIVQASLATAVRTAAQQVQAVGGMAQWRNQQRRDHEGASGGSLPPPRCVNFGRSLSLNKPRRKGSMDESLSSFANSLARHGSLGELSSRYPRRGSSGFKDSTLSSFADQLLDTTIGVADPAWLDFRRHSVGGERANLFRRGSGESRSSSLSRHSSMDILFPPCSTPEEPPPWGVNPGRRSSREVVLDLLSSVPSSDSHTAHRRRQQSLTSHLDWFAQDLLMEAFNDALIELFGQGYLESVDYQRRQLRQRSRSRGPIATSAEDRQLVEFADSFVKDILQQAVELVTEEDSAKRRRQRAPSEEEEDGSNYEDALDIPFQMLDTFATSLASSVMGAARIEVVRKRQRGPHAIATGNWGCGAFRGNPQVKSLLQWAAASCAGAPAMHYYTFQSPDMQRLSEVIDSVRRRGWNVGHILQFVVQYARQRRYSNDENLPSLFDMLL